MYEIDGLDGVLLLNYYLYMASVVNTSASYGKGYPHTYAQVPAREGQNSNTWERINVPAHLTALAKTK